MIESTHELDNDLSDLRADADRSAGLQRVSYVEGMLLGQEATRAEQAYHRRRFTRRQHFLDGMGTIAGLAVGVQEQPLDVGMRTELLVNAGLAIDGLGREIAVGEQYCLDLDRWLDTRDPATLTPGLGPEQAGRRSLHCYLTIRYQSYAKSLTPVLARKLNAGTDAVDFSRIGDGFEFELALDPKQGAEDVEWAHHLAAFAAVRDHGPRPFTQLEQDFVAAQGPEFSEEAGRRAHLLHAFQEKLPQPDPDHHESILQGLARVPLAAVRISLPVQSGAVVLQANAADVSVNNMMRPFVESALHSHLPTTTI